MGPKRLVCGRLDAAAAAGWSVWVEGPQLSCQRDFDFNEPMGLEKKKKEPNRTYKNA